MDAVIGLPSNIFFGTPIPTCIMVFKKNRVNSENILFIDASQEFEKSTNQNVLRKEHIDRIMKVYSERKEEEKFSFVASKDALVENEFNLNIPRYVDTFEEEEPVDLAAVSNELQSMENDIAQTDESISSFCDELNIKPPF